MDLGKGFSPSGDLYIFPENAAFNNDKIFNSISIKGKEIAEMRPLHVEKKKNQVYGKQKYSCISIPLLSFSR